MFNWASSQLCQHTNDFSATPGSPGWKSMPRNFLHWLGLTGLSFQHTGQGEHPKPVYLERILSHLTWGLQSYNLIPTGLENYKPRMTLSPEASDSQEATKATLQTPSTDSFTLRPLPTSLVRNPSFWSKLDWEPLPPTESELHSEDQGCHLVLRQ